MNAQKIFSIFSGIDGPVLSGNAVTVSIVEQTDCSRIDVMIFFLIVERYLHDLETRMIISDVQQ